eukprot:gene8457-biopygen9171
MDPYGGNVPQMGNLVAVSSPGSRRHPQASCGGREKRPPAPRRATRQRPAFRETSPSHPVPAKCSPGPLLSPRQRAEGREEKLRRGRVPRVSGQHAGQDLRYIQGCGGSCTPGRRIRFPVAVVRGYSKKSKKTGHRLNKKTGADFPDFPSA